MSIVETVVGALVGGVLAIAAGTVAARSSRANETIRRREDRHLDLSRDALSTLQRLVRATINVAYIDLPTRSANQTDTAAQAEARAVFERAVTDWNAAMYGVLVGADSAAADSVRRIDKEVDRLTGLALKNNGIVSPFERSVGISAG